MRKIERHPSNQGSVITFDKFGVTSKLFVADAKYRSISTFGSSVVRIPTLFKAMSLNLDKSELTDKILQQYFAALRYENSSKELTDCFMEYPDTEAAHRCRSIELKGSGTLDMPNLYETLVIYGEAERIDELDPTVNDYKQYALGNINPNGQLELITIYTNCVRNFMNEADNQAEMCVNNTIDNTYGVVPVKSLY